MKPRVCADLCSHKHKSLHHRWQTLLWLDQQTKQVTVQLTLDSFISRWILREDAAVYLFHISHESRAFLSPWDINTRWSFNHLEASFNNTSSLYGLQKLFSSSLYCLFFKLQLLFLLPNQDGSCNNTYVYTENQISFLFFFLFTCQAHVSKCVLLFLYLDAQVYFSPL